MVSRTAPAVVPRTRAQLGPEATEADEADRGGPSFLIELEVLILNLQLRTSIKMFLIAIKIKLRLSGNRVRSSFQRLRKSYL